MDRSATVNHDNLTVHVQFLSNRLGLYCQVKKDLFTSLHKIKAIIPLWAEFEILRNGALSQGLM